MVQQVSLHEAELQQAVCAQAELHAFQLSMSCCAERASRWGFDATPSPSLNVRNEYSIRLDEASGWRVTSEVSAGAFEDFDRCRRPLRRK